MAGRLTLLSEAQNPAQTQDGAASFANQLNPAQSQGPQDHLPPQGDAAQNAMAERDVTLTDTVTETSGAPTASPQPLPADTRATATPGPTPQRLPDAAPLDTTQSGWEAALTERITARPTDLGQEIEITLNPENLGHIRIKLDLSDKAATVQIVTDTPQAAHLFQQSETRLAEALNRAGLSLTSHDATSRDAGGREGGQGGQRQGQTPGNPRAEVALAGLRGTLAAPSVSGRAANLVNIVA
jgi:flagellar hook-length control protein FliK